MTATIRFTMRRLAGVVVTLFVASVVIYAALAIAPGDPAAALAGGTVPNPEVLASIRTEYHLDDPFWTQYWHWLSGLLGGDLGRSMVFRSDIADLLAGRVVNTLMLVCYAGLLTVGFGVGLGVLAALRGGRVDTSVTVGTSVAMAVPTFVLAIVLIWIFATHLSWLPVYGSGDGFADKLRHLTLPAIALSFSYVAYVARITRAAVSSELHSEHVDTARSRGLPYRRIIRHHVLRNSAGPILTISGTVVASLVAGTAVAEAAFGVNGLGSLLVQSAQRQDLAVVQILSMLMVGVFIVVNTVVDVVNVALDPRLARGGRNT
ncbi:peptide/nickel transport system permease protein [Kibdelosporangium banguiense]|uniref:Peptide/nickel transport system permease protein n=1 Tax=Kibdelosporangium banguiense TaxID=1365924 RepID=A0ABS4TXZ5_9PSEU|nr:ABC transporter permease [Kibdelosporangium banguiense]MBP2329275.1 peptide/nickel transport system permease protein [Kibdelosporangium banguiense]